MVVIDLRAQSLNSGVQQDRYYEGLEDGIAKGVELDLEESPWSSWPTMVPKAEGSALCLRGPLCGLTKIVQNVCVVTRLS